MSSYYDYRDVKVMIAHKLMSMEGWKVYGYHADESDSMTDYYSPAYWNGVAEKNGYVLCVDVYGASEAQEIREYNYSNFTYNKDIQEKIAKLEQMTIERGASEQEEESAKMMIRKLQQKAEQETENKNKYKVVGIIPAHQAHPPKCNWHIEKDGVIVAKGNGILKYASIDSYYKYDHYINDLNEYKKDKKAYREKHINKLLSNRYCHTQEDAEQQTQYHINQLEKDIKLINQFEEFIRKIDSTCGSMIGEGDQVIYEKIKVTEYKKENKAVETSSGSIKEGQCFILKSNFNYNRHKGYVYRIHEGDYNGKKYYYAYKLNGKLTKECTGSANQANYWHISDKFMKWIEKNDIAWCEIQEVKTPYEVEKVVKKVIRTENKEQKEQQAEQYQEKTELNNLTYDINEDVDTRDNSRIYVVKVKEKLSKNEYIQVNKYMKSIGGYYSKFKHGFIFKDNPTDLLNNNRNEIKQSEEQEQQTEEQEKKSIDFEIEQSKHTKTNENIWLVKIKNSLTKDEFAELKRKFATLKGFYSTFTNSFIFKYDPTEILQSG